MKEQCKKLGDCYTLTKMWCNDCVDKMLKRDYKRGKNAGLIEGLTFFVDEIEKEKKKRKRKSSKTATKKN